MEGNVPNNLTEEQRRSYNLALEKIRNASEMYDEESEHEIDLSAIGMDDRVFALVLNDLIRENRKHEIAKLDLGENYLTQIPREIEQLNKIDHLVLDNNEFTVFPVNVICLKRLANLSLVDNGITIIPNEITVLRDLECLDVSNNMITTIPDNVVRRVQDIDASGNPIPQEEAQRLEALNQDFVYDMSYFGVQNQDISWEGVLDKIDILSPQTHNDAKLVINKSDGLKAFISMVNL
jgi:Leucine-rich repeat (LRR) protein